MHIISGIYKGKALEAPHNIRPTEDRIRKALFDIINDVEDLVILELFAGSGAVGLEALSLGAKEVVFVENDRASLGAIQKNINNLGVNKPDSNKKTEVIHKDAIEIIPLIFKNNKKFDLVFADPPYYQGLTEKTLQSIALYDILSELGLLVLQHFKKDFAPESAGNLKLFKQAKYGDSLLSFYRKV